MFHLKNKTIMKIAIFAVITMVILWLLPVGLISAEGTDETPKETTVATTTETTVETTAETTIETTAETTVETAAETTAETTVETTAETTAETTVENTAETTAETTVETTAETVAETTVETTAETIEETTAETTIDTGATEVINSVILNPTLKVEEPDYIPGSTVKIKGTGFAPNTNYTILVIPEGSHIVGDGTLLSDSFSIITGADGSFTLEFELKVGANKFIVKAVDADGNVVATTSFTDCNVTLHKSGLLGDTKAHFKLEQNSGGWSIVSPEKDLGNESFIWYPTPGNDCQLTETIPDGYTIQWEVKVNGSTVSGPSTSNPIFISSSWAAGGCDVYVTNIPVGKVIITKDVLDPNGNPVNDTTGSFEISLDGVSQGSLMDGQSTAEITVNPGNHHTVAETLPASGYDFVSIDGNNSNPYSFDVAAGQTKTILIINKQKPGKITINKSWLDESGLPYNPTNDGAEFRLYDSNHNQVGGVITLNNTTTSGFWDGLLWDSYTIVETLLGSNINNWTPSPASPIGPITIDAGNNGANLDRTVNIENRNAQQKTATINVYKVVVGTVNSSEFGFTVNPGAIGFTLPGAGGGPYAITVYAGNTYTVAETDPGDDWLPVAIVAADIPGTVNPDGSFTFLVDGTNIDSINGKSIDFTNTRKTCGVFVIKTVDGVEPAEGSFGFAFTGTPGNFTLDGSPYSLPLAVECGVEYTITEDSLPADFDLNDITFTGDFIKAEKNIANKTFTFILRCTDNNDGDNEELVGLATAVAIDQAIDHTITFDNYIPSVTKHVTKHGTIKIQKVPAVAGVGFTLFKSDGTTVVAAEKLTDETGEVKFSGLKYDTYIVKETKGIDGYSLAADQKVVVDSTSAISLTFTNTPITTGGGIEVAGLTTPGFIQVLAFTGLDPIIPISGGSAVIGGVAMLLATLRRKRNKK